MTREEAEHFGRTVAISLFLTMLNPKYRGPKFTWDKFPDMVRRHVSSQFGLTALRPRDENEDAAIKAAERWVEYALLESGLKE